MMDLGVRRGIGRALAFGRLLMASAPASADDQTPPAPAAPAPAAPAPEETTPEEARLQVHGYLNQAFADTDEGVLFGIPPSGTFDYRTAALQFRFAMTDHDNLVLQLSNKRLGESPVMQVEPDVRLDWAFYERRFAGSGSFKAGRVPIPQGIYNELRDVGTVLPFYRVPFNFYQEGSYTSETLDGVQLSYTVFDSKKWPLELHAYFGGWELIETLGGATPVTVARAEQGLGGQLWLRTPLPGVRLGLGGQTYNVRGGARPPGQKEDWNTWYASFDGEYQRVKLQAEYRAVNIGADTDFEAFYILAAVNVLKGLSVNALGDFGNLQFPGLDRDLHRDWAVGVSYAFRPNLVAKAEYHWATTFIEDDRALGFLDPQPAGKINYTILSLAASF
jgi:hypothetical protein